MRILLAAAGLLLLVVPTRPAAAQAPVRSVAIVVAGPNRWAYQPSPIQIRVGETVEWTNRDPDDAHNVSIAALDYDGRFLALNESDQVTFQRPGVYAYACLPHPSMTGVVIVASEVFVPVVAKGGPVG
ncbi:MAG: plastocyanin/azurin family copper-binding protein [Dehalococcoidia bacterium]